jgi:hypothetical protein
MMDKGGRITPWLLPYICYLDDLIALTPPPPPMGINHYHRSLPSLLIISFFQPSKVEITTWLRPFSPLSQKLQS